MNPVRGNAGNVITVTVNPDISMQLALGSLKYTADGGTTYKEVTKINGIYSFILLKADVVVIAEFMTENTQPKYIIIPIEDEVYKTEIMDDGFNLMVINLEYSGMRYFSVEVVPIINYKRLKTVDFVHFKDSVQFSINTIRADFDLASLTQAGFNIDSGDLVKVFIVDKLINEKNRNPIILQ